jgi:GNAT superfamily N-acetyltransferase
MKISIHSGYRPGAIGRIVQLHGESYANLAGFGLAFESLIARELSAFCESLDESRDGIWLALRDGVIEGSIAIQSTGMPLGQAHLRWFVVSEALRGAGVGRALLDEAIGFCRQTGQSSLDLWTFEGLDAARSLYERAGFRLAFERRGRRWGAEVKEQRFQLDLRQAASRG